MFVAEGFEFGNKRCTVVVTVGAGPMMSSQRETWHCLFCGLYLSEVLWDVVQGSVVEAVVVSSQRERSSSIVLSFGM